MWVSQSYLADVQGEASCFVYYLFEDYNDAQMRYSAEIENALESFGNQYGTEAQLFLPREKSADHITAQLRSVFNDFSHRFSGKLPGLLTIDRQLKDFDPRQHDSIYTSLAGVAPDAVQARMDELGQAINETIARKNSEGGQYAQTVLSVWDRLHIQPEIFGISILLKQGRI
jgi:hypothetical protein